MHWLLKRLIGGVILLSCSVSVVARVITMGAYDFPPYAYKTAQGGCEGVVIDDTRRIVELLGGELQVICVNPARLYKLLGSGEVDLAINVSSTRALKSIVDFVEPAYMSLNLVLIGKTQGDLVSPKSIAAIRGYDYVGFRQRYADSARFIDGTDASHAAELFLKGRAEALLTYKSNFVSRSDVKPEDFAITSLLSVPSYFIVSRHSPHRAWLVERLTLAMEKAQHQPPSE